MGTEKAEKPKKKSPIPKVKSKPSPKAEKTVRGKKQKQTPKAAEEEDTKQ